MQPPSRTRKYCTGEHNQPNNRCFVDFSYDLVWANIFLRVRTPQTKEQNKMYRGLIRSSTNLSAYINKLAA